MLKLRQLLEWFHGKTKADEREQQIHDLLHEMDMTRRMRLVEERQNIKMRHGDHDQS